MDEDRQLYEQARLLVQRLERISVDSIWARRSSGHRGALLRWIEQFEGLDGQVELLPEEKIRLRSLVDTGFRLLERAALERLR
ncbi:MAG: hypothetical protein A2W35_00940 [Chloroflexi bacterium RBG_16_57_11]|nr:MAG: hypothetical protein A2W35_00940 [Chloroflexi bacterium RBG_16_57_11]